MLNEMYSGFLSSLQARWYTRKLKIEPFERYVGNDTTFSYLGHPLGRRQGGLYAQETTGLLRSTQPDSDIRLK